VAYAEVFKFHDPQGYLQPLPNTFVFANRDATFHYMRSVYILTIFFESTFHVFC